MDRARAGVRKHPGHRTTIADHRSLAEWDMTLSRLDRSCEALAPSTLAEKFVLAWGKTFIGGRVGERRAWQLRRFGVNHPGAGVAGVCP